MDQKNLEFLKQQWEDQARLQEQVRALEIQQRELAGQVHQLAREREKEQADVDRLEAGGLTSLFYRLSGRMEEKLSQEQQEARQARTEYESAQWQLTGVQDQLARAESELRRMPQDCEAAYRQALAEKAGELKAAGGPAAEEILRLEEEMAGAERQEQELERPAFAVQKAREAVEAALEKLDSADDWATYDLWGGGVLADIAKHDRLEEAQAAMEELQGWLMRLRTDLPEVPLGDDLRARVDGGLRAADYFFDGIFVDLTVKDHIEKNQSQMRQIQDWLLETRTRLKNKKEELVQRRAVLRQSWEQRVYEADVPEH